MAETTTVTAPAVQVGQEVRYVPHRERWNEDDHRGNPTHHFHHAVSGEPVNVKHHEGVIRHVPGGPLVTKVGNIPVVAGAHKYAWKAVVEAAHPDGTCDLAVHSPRGGITYQDRRVPFSAQQDPHSWHLPA